jgi:glycine C-acetyltransferase
VATFLREKAITYIYSNPITAAEAGVALKVVNYIDTPQGQKRLQKLSRLTSQFEDGLKELGLETIESPHPIVPLMVRDTEKTSTLVAHLFQQGVLATGLNYPVVPKGDQSIRFQINADHTSADIDYVLKVLEKGL